MAAIALNGAVILSQKGTQITYSRKCEKCGAVQPGNVITGISSSSSTTMTSGFHCSKCGNNQKVVIKGG